MKSQLSNCLTCGKLLRGVQTVAYPGLCSVCTEGIPWIQEVQCSLCGRASACPDCQRRLERPLLLNRSAVEYTEQMKEWLALYKYRGDERLGPMLAWMVEHAYGLMQQTMQTSGIRLHGISYVPLSPMRLKERGFNQAEQFALCLGRRYRLPVVPLLERNRHTGKQSYKTRAERFEDLAFAFSVLPQAAAALKPGMCFLLVDDVYTTGATLHSCASELRRVCRVNSFGLTWAR